MYLTFLHLVEAMNPPDSLLAFCKELEVNNTLQSQVKESKSPDQIIEIAASIGHEISIKDLRFWSRELSAPYFPWSEMGHTFRRNFFR